MGGGAGGGWHTDMQTAIEKKACNALLLKVNQIGSLSESIQAYGAPMLVARERAHHSLLTLGPCVPGTA